MKARKRDPGPSPSGRDPVTGLPNRVLLGDRISQALAAASRYGWKPALLFLDLDDFRTVNDALGHAVGDELLRCLSTRLTSQIRASDALARIGSDQFGLLLTNPAREFEAARVARKILNSLAHEPLRLLGENEFFTTLSIGIAMFPQDGSRAPDLLANAETAMHHAKQSGGNQVQFYNREINLFALERLSFEQKLRAACGRGELLLHYQPQVDVSRGRLVGAEALLRWQHPELGLLPPGRFLPIAEETRQIVPIGEWALRRACEQRKAWESVAPPGFRVAVNVSGVQFQRPDFAALVAEILEDTRLRPEYLELEITESCLMENPELTVLMLESLKELGVRIVIDDFGTGFSSLMYLKLLPVDCLKVDQSFVRGALSDPADSTIASAVVTMARGLNLTTTAEGVETEQQMRLLASFGCTRMQGFLFGKPDVPEAIEGAFGSNPLASLGSGMLPSRREGSRADPRAPHARESGVEQGDPPPSTEPEPLP